MAQIMAARKSGAVSIGGWWFRMEAVVDGLVIRWLALLKGND